MTAEQRVGKFLEFWREDHSRGDIIYGLGIRDELRELTVGDLQEIVASNASLRRKVKRLSMHSETGDNRG